MKFMSDYVFLFIQNESKRLNKSCSLWYLSILLEIKKKYKKKVKIFLNVQIKKR